MTIWYIALALFGLVLGAAQGWLGMAAARAPLARDGELLTWSDPPHWPWVTDPVGSALVLTHAVALWSLLVLLLLALSAMPPDPAGFAAWLASAAVLFAGLLGGIPLIFPFASRFVGPVRRSVTPDTLVFGHYVIAWASCSHYTVDWPRQTLVAYSARNPTVHVFDSRPADPGTLQQVVALTAQHLPERPPVRTGPVERWGYILLLLVVTVPFVTLGLLLGRYGVAWAWMYDTLALLLVFVLGGRVLRSTLPVGLTRQAAAALPRKRVWQDPLVLLLAGILGLLIVFSNLLIACVLLAQSLWYALPR